MKKSFIVLLLLIPLVASGSPCSDGWTGGLGGPCSDGVGDSAPAIQPSEQWTTEEVRPRLLTDDGMVFRWNGSHLRWEEIQSQEVKWAHNYTSDVDPGVTGQNDDIIVMGYGADKITAFDKNTGQRLWTSPAPDGTNEPISGYIEVTDQQIWMTSASERVATYDLDGDKKYEREAETSFQAPYYRDLVVRGKYVVQPFSDGNDMFWYKMNESGSTLIDSPEPYPETANRGRPVYHNGHIIVINQGWISVWNWSDKTEPPTHYRSFNTTLDLRADRSWTNDAPARIAVKDGDIYLLGENTNRTGIAWGRYDIDDGFELKVALPDSDNGEMTATDDGLLIRNESSVMKYNDTGYEQWTVDVPDTTLRFYDSRAIGTGQGFLLVGSPATANDVSGYWGLNLKVFYNKEGLVTNEFRGTEGGAVNIGTSQ